ncbi:tetratricopeptide repeat protein [Nitrosomonas sp. Nm34]|uniref:tetratricopeptide repeat protein n=1 Tax=Nitrosomonas sp. Nm34 TaxID=1881055 RepID=UPI0008E12A79|nr:tetratricopeptide repeat protein [Nitrosomonas sp. Nm34]SFI27565.1 Flp pilus assembly protein TadD, contains TPR repeats [Nitrosomonas sp. Nm34]
MIHLKQLICTLVCLFAVAGCATQLGKNKPGLTGEDKKESTQTARDLETMYQSGRKYQEEARFTEAITTYENILAIDPHYSEAHNGLGVIYSIQGKFEPALQHLQRAVALAPLASHLRNNLGYTYFLLGRKPEAISEFEQALRLDPGNEKARANIATIRNKVDTAETIGE